MQQLLHQELLHSLLISNLLQALSRKKDIKAFSGLVFQDSNKVDNQPGTFAIKIFSKSLQEGLRMP